MEDVIAAETQLSFEEKVANTTIISQPLADEKLTSRIHKLVKKASLKKKTSFRMGVKLVMKSIRKGEKGIIIMGGDVMPLDTICHVPILCEEKEIPHVFVPSKNDFGAAVGTRGPVLIAHVLKDEDYEDNYDKVLKAVKKLN